MHVRSYRAVIREKIWVEAGGRFAVGDGGVQLLSAIDKTGSIRSAAEQLGWSYRHALAYLDNTETRLDRKLVERVRGGSDRGGARLTAEGLSFVRRYIGFRRRVESVLSRLAREAFAGVL